MKNLDQLYRKFESEPDKTTLLPLLFNLARINPQEMFGFLYGNGAAYEIFSQDLDIVKAIAPQFASEEALWDVRNEYMDRDRDLILLELFQAAFISSPYMRTLVNDIKKYQFSDVNPLLRAVLKQWRLSGESAYICLLRLKILTILGLDIEKKIYTARQLASTEECGDYLDNLYELILEETAGIKKLNNQQSFYVNALISAFAPFARSNMEAYNEKSLTILEILRNHELPEVRFLTLNQLIAIALNVHLFQETELEETLFSMFHDSLLRDEDNRKDLLRLLGAELMESRLIPYLREATLQPTNDLDAFLQGIEAIFLSVEFLNPDSLQEGIEALRAIRDYTPSRQIKSAAWDRIQELTTQLTSIGG